ENRDIRAMVVRLSQRVTQVQGDTPDVFFDLLATRTGATGPDVLFEIISTKGGSDAADRANKLLRDPAVRERGTPALRIAYDMRAAKGCRERMALLDRVRDDGDGRTLRPMLELNDECGRRSDCCQRDDPRLRAAMDALRDRGVVWR